LHPNCFNTSLAAIYHTITAKSYNSTTTLATYEPGNRFGDLYDFYEQYNRTEGVKESAAVQTKEGFV
jgi:hypothetical protein